MVTGTTATLTATAVAGSSLAYDVTATGGDLADLDGAVILSFAGSQDITDAAGNVLANTAPTGANDSIYLMDNLAPSVTITGVPDASSAPFTATISFSEGVSGFTLEDIAVGNGTASTFTGADGGRAYTALIRPSADGAVTLDVAADVARDAAGNGNLAAAQGSSTYTAPDITAPQVVSIEFRTPSSSPTNADSLTWRVAFSEDVQNVDGADFAVGGTTATLTTAAVPGSSAAHDVTAAGGNLADRDGAVTLSFVLGQNITDVVGNALANTTPTGTNEASYLVDNTGPSVTISGVPDASAAPFTATITFLEGVSGFVVEDIAVGNGTASNFTGSDRDTAFTALIRPTADGAVTVDVAADVARDAAGNGNEAAAQASSIYTAPDISAPRVASIEFQTPKQLQTNADSLTWRVTFSEVVANVDAADFMVTGTTATLTVTPVDSVTGAYDVTASAGNLGSLTGPVTLSFASGQDIGDASGNALANTMPTGTNEARYEVDNTVPIVISITRESPASSPTHADVLVWQVTFSEVVAKVDSADFEVTGTTATLTVAAVDPISPSQFDVTVEGGDLADLNATVTLAFAADHNIADPAGHELTTTDPTSTNDNTFELDNMAPTVTITGVPENSTASFTATITFTEPVTGFVMADITLTNATASNFTGADGDMVFTALITPSADGEVTVNVAADMATDAAGNGNTAAAQATSTYTAPLLDNTAPRLASIVRQNPTASPTDADELTWRVTFTEEVANVDAPDFTITGTTATLTVTPVTNETGAYDVTATAGDLAGLDATVTLAFAQAQDIADPANNALTNTTPTGANENTFVVDNTAPRLASIVRQNPTASPTDADELTWRVTFTEEVANVDAPDFTITGTTATLTVTPVTNETGAYDVTATAGDLAGLDATVTLAFAQAQDIADPANNALTNTTPSGANDNTFVLDNTAPRLASIARQNPTASPTDADELTWRVTFSEAVENVDTTDFTVTGTTATLTVAPVALVTGAYDVSASGGNLGSLDATVTLSFAAGQNIADRAGNALTNTAPTGANENAFVVDNTAPTVTITGVSATSMAAFMATFTFSEGVAGFAVEDITVGNGAASAFTGSGGDTEFTALITPTADGEVTVDVAADVAMDTAGNGNTAAAQASSIYDNTAPGVASIERQSPTSSPTNADVLTWRVTFSEAVANVDAADFTVAGTTATLTATAVSGSSAQYDVTVSGGNLAGLNATVTLSFAAGQNIQDAAGNALANTTPTGTNEASYVVDNIAPTVTISGVSPTSTAAFTVTITFSEGVNGFAVGDITVGNGTASAFTGSGGDTEFTALITPTADGAVTVDVAADVATDAAGNGNTAATQASSIYDNTAPTVTITGVSATSMAAFMATFTFSEGVAGFAVEDIAVGNGAASAFTGSDGDTEFTALITPTADGEVTVDVAADVATDAAGNGNTAATRVSSTYTAPPTDTVAPTVSSIMRQSPTSSPTNADVLTWRVTFSEAVANVDAADFTVAGTTATLTATAVSGSSAQYDVTVSGGNLAGLNATVTLSFVAGQNIQDVAGNALANTTPTGANEASYVVDNIAPTVEITGVPDASTAPFTATITFTEGVSGFAVGDITVGNGTASAFTGSDGGTVYTALITPTADGAVTVDVAADVTMDAAGNGNAAAAQASSIYDSTAPNVASIMRQSPASSPTNADSLTWRVTFSEDVANVDAADFAVSNTSATLTAAAVQGSSLAYDVSASGGNLGSLNATVTLAFVAGQNIADRAGNALTNTAPTGANENAFVVDNTAPTVTISRRVGDEHGRLHGDVHLLGGGGRFRRGGHRGGQRRGLGLHGVGWRYRVYGADHANGG